jgi:hypothetical protein
MSVASLVKRSIYCTIFAAVLLGCLSAPAALASPWWHLTSGARPAAIQPGLAQSEVQEVTAEAGGLFGLNAGGQSVGNFESAPYPRELLTKATAANVQTALENVYGAGNVLVTGGPAGVAPLVITSVNEDADVPVSPVEVAFSFGGTVSTHVVTKGRPDGNIVVTASNLGDANVEGSQTPVTITDRLPVGLRAVAVKGQAGLEGGFLGRGPVKCTLAPLACQLSGSLPPYDQIEMEIGVVAEAGATTGDNEARVSGGDAPSASVTRPVTVGNVSSSFGVEDYELMPEEEGGTPATQAGSHPFQLTTTLVLNQTIDADPAALAKDLTFNLPSGLIGNPTPFPRCTLAQFDTPVSIEGAEANLCPPTTAVGVAMVTVNAESIVAAFHHEGAATFSVPIFNLEPAIGEPARFGFLAAARAPVFLDTAVRTGGDYGVTVNVSNITQTAAFIKNEVTFWGVPGDTRHDSQRGWACIYDARGVAAPPCNASEAAHPPPLLALPTSCSGRPLQTSVEADSWIDAGAFQSFAATAPMPVMDGCNRLPFGSSVGVVPDGLVGSTPTGLTVGVHVPQEEALNPSGLEPADVRDTTVALPVGVVLNPAGADGLLACSEGQIGLSDALEAACPEASKVATVEIRTPLLPNPLTGAVYLAAQEANPFGSLVALYLVAQDPVSGTLVKLAGEVKPDPVTGQLVSTFLNTPQLPFEDLKLHFFGGSRAPLATPAYCGSYTTSASIVPWSGNETSRSSSTFQITGGPNGGPCADPLPFAPELTAGSLNLQAGGFTPFTTTMSRTDGQQSLQGIQLHMPPGLSGLLSGVKLCGETEGNAGTCGHDSEIGETIVSVGVGGTPFSVKGGKVFITGPYEGAPFGLSIVNPAKAGPYDLEKNTPCDCVVVRARIEVDPITAALTITTDDTGPYKIPTILDGIPLQIQHVNVTVNRPGFTFNPTNCDPMAITGSLQSTEGSSKALAVPFQVTNCATLKFKPGFKVSTAGKTSRANGASLNVKLTYPKAPFGSQANIKSVKVDLPKQLPSRLTTLQKACTSQQFQANPAGCPAASMVGHATATTPLIPVPLTGPAYFVSYGGAKFPELVIVLQGYGVTLDLHGETFINKTGITSSTFHTVPDAPVGTFNLVLPQGKYSALAANGNLCTTKLTMPTKFTAQNGTTIKQTTPITVTGCAKTKTHKTKKHNGASHKKSTHREK